MIAATDDEGFFAKYDPAGTLVWVETFGGAEWDYGNAIAVGADGSIVAAGEVRATATCLVGDPNAETLVSSGLEDGLLLKMVAE